MVLARRFLQGRNISPLPRGLLDSIELNVSKSASVSLLMKKANHLAWSLSPWLGPLKISGLWTLEVIGMKRRAGH